MIYVGGLVLNLLEKYMVFVNKVIFVGNFGVDFEVCYLLSGDVVVNICFVMIDCYKDKVSGDFKEMIEWYCVVFFGCLVEIVSEYLKKGLLVYIEGCICMCKW